MVFGETLMVKSVTIHHRVNGCWERFRNALLTIKGGTKLSKNVCNELSKYMCVCVPYIVDTNQGGNEVQVGGIFAGPATRSTIQTIFECGSIPIKATELKLTILTTDFLQVNKVTVQHGKQSNFPLLQ